ncbi:hypothetical protein PL9631_110040 [Planktothrix paucivesiculata PCC 9631]|uniref:Uncharacterized protein n=1 Tax=Planktothrix paucivesiculata PCC 9631 TaxID=671071 RepID=A0A7Z9DZ32_9CYAN|nr:hypothetical protein PL9631_110040 [Planktothrix paucivesiculata PCC 9631]
MHQLKGWNNPTLTLPLSSQGVFIVGGKKENKSDLFLVKSKKDHFYLILKNYVKQYNRTTEVSQGFSEKSW